MDEGELLAAIAFFQRVCIYNLLSMNLIYVIFVLFIFLFTYLLIFLNFPFIPYKLYYNTGFSYVTNNIHCGMAQAKLTWITLRLRRESALNNSNIYRHILVTYFSIFIYSRMDNSSIELTFLFANRR